LFRASKFDAAIDEFIELDFNPAKVVALYPESVAGRLSVPQDGWIALYGGPVSAEEEPLPSEGLHDNDTDNASLMSSHERTATELFDSIIPSGGSIGGRLRRGILLPGVHNDADTASITSKRKVGSQGASTSRSLLLYDI